MPNGQIPGLPQFNFNVPNLPSTIDENAIFKLLQQPPRSLTNLALPYIQQQFDVTGQAIAPALAGIREATAGRVAEAQSEAMRRGLTASDIEASAMQAERATGARAEAELTGQVALQQAQTMANAIMQTLQQDTAQEQQMFMNMAQAIGQKLSRDDQMRMFQMAIQAQKEAARAGKKQSLWQSLAQIAAPIVGTVLGGPIGGALGAGISGLFTSGGGGNLPPPSPTTIPIGGGEATV